jgi:two-component system, chemotaxis family, chemotaxis protein CheY
VRAIVIDDSRATRAILRRILEELGHTVVEAADGEQALAVLRVEEVQLALVDWNMPVMDGLQFVRAARQDPGLDGLIIVMVTTEGDVDHLVTALEAGANEYAMKPFTSSVIREKLALLGVAG